MKISGLVITYNEEKNIGKCIDALFQVCDEIIVVDSLSKDKTVAICESKGVKVISQTFLGDGPQRIAGLAYCTNDWILNLDADEFLDMDAIDFIKKGSFFKNEYDAYSFCTKNFLQDKIIDFAGWYPDRKVRFFNKKTASPSTDIVHQKVVYTNLKKLKVHLLHYGSHSFFQIIAKKNQYAIWNAEQLLNQGKRVSIFKPVLNGWVSFIRCYFFKKGFLNGIDGLTISLTQGYFSYVKYASLIQLQKEAKNKKL
jgi:glycosyltransferase involved in cell wall biosynthesis